MPSPALHPRFALPVALGASLLFVGCAAKVDKLTVKRVVARAQQVPDVDQACKIGVSLRSPLAAVTKEGKPAHKALLIAEVTAGMCDEQAAWDAEIELAQAQADSTALSPQTRYALARDARIQADRAHTRAAERYLRAVEHGQQAFGELGGDCPALKEWEELPYMLTLVAGLQSVLHDSAAGSPLGIPKELILDVARSAQCLDDDKWWFGPSAMQASAWATIPGSGPEGVDPWAMLDESAGKSDATGVRVSRGLQVTIAMNAGRDDLAQQAIQAHAAAAQATPSNPEFALFDRYATLLSRHQSDLLWLKEQGHRTPVFGELPKDDQAQPDDAGSDPFAGDPFGEDPFGGDATDPADPEATEADGAPASPDAPPDSGKEDE